VSEKLSMLPPVALLNWRLKRFCALTETVVAVSVTLSAQH
jgi:hypothetical protein